MALSFLLGSSLVAQEKFSSATYTDTYVHAKGSLAFFGNHYFGSPSSGVSSGIVFTNRSKNPGIISFVNKALWANANDFQHVDGYVRSFKESSFTFPIGNLGFYRPIAVQDGGYGMVAAYYLDNPTQHHSVALKGNQESSFTISDSEFWHISGRNQAVITLTYDRNSDIEKLTSGNLNDLKIFGWNGETWEAIPSSVDAYALDFDRADGAYTSTESNFDLGSITTSAAINPDDYQLLTFGVEQRTSPNTINIEADITSLQAESLDLTVFPNPTFDLNELHLDYNIQGVQGEAKVVIYNMAGELLFSQQLEKQKDILRLNYNNSINGTYHIGIVTQNGSRLFRPVIVTAK